jgi:hypothetical protein
MEMKRKKTRLYENRKRGLEMTTQFPCSGEIHDSDLE